MNLKFKKLHENAVLPTHSKHGDAGMDLTATKISCTGGLETHYYGLSVQIPEGNAGLLFPRSSVKGYDVRLSNCVGVVDSGYRGEIMAVFDLIPSSDKSYTPGDRSSQLVIVPFVSCNTEWAEELSETERGLGGYGSTGK